MRGHSQPSIQAHFEKSNLLVPEPLLLSNRNIIFLNRGDIILNMGILYSLELEVIMFEGAEQVHRLLGLLAEALEVEEAESVELVVCGGAALQVIGLVTRTTEDIDVVASVVDGKDTDPEPFSAPLKRAIQRVGVDHGLPEDWLNSGPRDNQRLGLPKGLVGRAMVKEYGPLLKVRFIDRIDQIHFKLYASVDQGPGKHVDDLMALAPDADELEAAATWAMTHDVSEAFKETLLQALRVLGFEDVASRLDE